MSYDLDCRAFLLALKGIFEDMAARQEDIDLLANSLKLLLEAEKLSSQEPKRVNLQQVAISGLIVIEHARVHSSGADSQLRDIEQRLTELEKRSAPPSGLQKFIHSLIRIGVATIAGAAIGAPLGAWLVSDEMMKEVVKAAIAASISQTCMEVAEAGLDVRSTKRNASWSASTMDAASQNAALTIVDRVLDRAQEPVWESVDNPHGHAAGDDDARAR